MEHQQKMVSNGFEEWNGNGAAAIRSALSMPASLIPLYAVPVGHGGVVPEFPAGSFLLLSLLAVMALTAALRLCLKTPE